MATAATSVMIFTGMGDHSKFTTPNNYAYTVLTNHN
jgi:hypothetical protein